MSIKEINSKKLFKEFEIKIPFAEVDKSIDSKIVKIMPTVTLPGFRKGKAPLSIVRKKYEGNILSEVIEKIVKDKTNELIEEKKLKVFRQPKVEIKKYEKNKPVEIGIKVDLEPKIDLYPFEKITLNKYSIDLDKKSIDENFNRFVDSQKHYHKVNDIREIKLSDKVIINLSSEDSIVPDYLKSQKELSIITDSDYQILPDISKKLISKKVKVGDKIKLKFNLKDILKSKDKKEAEFLIEILSLEHSHEFQITKDFLDKNNLKSEKDLRDNLEKNFKLQYDEQLEQLTKKELMDVLENKNIFDVPEGVLEEEFNSIWQRLEHAKKEGKLDDDDKGLSEDKLKKRYEKISLRRVKLAILMQFIAKEQNINVSEKDLTDGMLKYASQYPGQEKQIFEYFKENPSGVEQIRGPIFEQKIVDFILSKIKLNAKKINMKDFEKLQQESYKMSKE